MIDEGVIKFVAEHQRGGLRASEMGQELGQLRAWRALMLRTDMVGEVQERYGGAGFGNLSARLAPASSGQGRRRFLITGTQTGGKDVMNTEDFCVVRQYDLAKNRVQSYGPVLPSSESLTHGAIYDLTPHIRYVFHGHSPLIWTAAAKLKIPSTAAGVGYGTQAMAWEVQRLYRSGALPERQVLAMAGHEDGVIAFGHSAEDAGNALIREWIRAFQTR